MSLPFFWFNSYLWERGVRLGWHKGGFFFFSFFFFKEAFSHSSELSKIFYYQLFCFCIHKSFLQLLCGHGNKGFGLKRRGHPFLPWSYPIEPLLQRKRREKILLSQFSKVSESQRGHSSSQLALLSLFQSGSLTFLSNNLCLFYIQLLFQSRYKE